MWMFGWVGGVFSALGFGSFGFEGDFCFKEVDLGRMLAKKRELADAVL